MRLILLLLITSCNTVQQPAPPVCRITELVGWKTSEDMTVLDKLNYRVAKNGCPKRYNGRSPCLVKFIKTGDYSYFAQCGHVSKENE